MSITVECDGCSKKYRVPDERAGTVIRCKDCGEKIQIPDDDDEAPPASRPARRKPSASGNKRKKTGANVGLILGVIGGGIALMMIIGGLLAWTFFGRASRPDPNVTPGPSPVAGAGAPAVALGGSNVPVTAAVWSVVADPPSRAITWPDSPPKLDGFRGQLSQVIYKAPFAVTGTVGGNDYLRVWNLSTGEIVGQIDRPKPQLSGAKSALSPDGTLIALVPSGKTDVELWSVRDAKLTKTISAAKAKSSIDYIDLVSANQLVVIETDKSTGSGVHRLAILDLATGNRGRERVLPEGVYYEKVALSPGSRFLVIDHGYKEGLGFYDLTNCAAAGRVPPGEYCEGGSGSSGLRFSPDGAKLGILGTAGGATSVIVVDVASGKAQKAATMQGSVASVSYSNSPGLQWLENGQGWLAGGNILFDAVSGKAVWKIQTEENPYGLENGRLRIPVKSSIWSVNGPDNEGELARIEIPWTTIRERLEKLNDESNLVRPGAGVTLAVNVGEVRFANAEEVKRELTQGLIGRLTAMKLKPEDGQPLTLRAVYSEAPGNTMQFGGLGLGATPNKNVQATKSTLILQLTDATGQKSYWNHKIENDPRTMFMKGEPTAENVRKNTFDGMLSGLRSLSLPDYVTGDPAVQLPVQHPLPRW